MDAGVSNTLVAFSEREFIWHNIHQPNRDLVLGALPGADGLKTGHTDAAGYGITISAKRGSQRLIHRLEHTEPVEDLEMTIPSRLGFPSAAASRACHGS